MTVDEVLGYDIAFQDNNGRTMINLPDFAAGQFERVVAKVTVNAPGAGESFDVSNIKLNYTDMLKGAGVADAPAQRAHDRQGRRRLVEPRQRRDGVCGARDERLEHAGGRRSAEGRRPPEGQPTCCSRMRTSSKRPARSPAKERSRRTRPRLKQWNDTFTGARTDDEVQAATKGAKRKARLDFGLNSSTY